MARRGQALLITIFQLEQMGAFSPKPWTQRIDLLRALEPFLRPFEIPHEGEDTSAQAAEILPAVAGSLVLARPFLEQTQELPGGQGTALFEDCGGEVGLGLCVLRRGAIGAEVQPASQASTRDQAPAGPGPARKGRGA